MGDDDVPLADYSAGQLTPPAGKPRRAMNALVPILTVAGLTVIGRYVTGSAVTDRGEHGTAFSWIQAVFANADSYRALLWASMAGMLMAMALPLAQRILSIREATGAMVEGFR